MGEILKDRAVILRRFDYGESSVIAVVLTRQHGKIRLIAKGARKNRSQFHGRLRTGNIGEIVYYDKPGRGLQLLKEISSRPVFDSDSSELERLCLFQAGLEIVERSMVDEGADEGVYDLLEDFIRFVQSSRDPWAVFLAFEMQLLMRAGIYPVMSECCGCKKNLAGKRLNVDPSKGNVTCGDCREEGSVSLSAESGAILAIMEDDGIEGLAGERLNAVQRREIGRLLHNLLVHHVERYRLPNSLGLIKELT